MQDITIGRCTSDPDALGVITPKDESWHLIIDKEGRPHLYVNVKLELEGKVVRRPFAVEYLFHDKLTMEDLMEKICFGGELSEEEEAEAFAEYTKDQETRKLPCPRAGFEG